MTCRLLVYPEMFWAVFHVFIVLYKLTSVILETWHELKVQISFKHKVFLHGVFTTMLDMHKKH